MAHSDVERITALIKRVAANRTVLMVEHNLSVVSTLSDRITVLARGEILAEGDYATVSKNPQSSRPTSAPSLKPARHLGPAIEGLNAWYGESHILHGMDFDIGEGEVVTLLGRNGAGKTTTLKSIMGMVGRREGSINFKAKSSHRAHFQPDRALGIAFCPEERGIFASLDVEENLLLPPQVATGGLRSSRSSSCSRTCRSG